VIERKRLERLILNALQTVERLELEVALIASITETEDALDYETAIDDLREYLNERFTELED